MNPPNRQRKSDIKYSITLNEEQKIAKSLIIHNQVIIITGRAGCLAKNTKVLMYDGTFKEVQDIVANDLLMGVDSTPRRVLRLYRGQQQMYWIRQKRGLDYRVNEDHILSLIRNTPAIRSRYTEGGVRKFDYSTKPLHAKKTEISNISVRDFLQLPSRVRNKQLKGYISEALHFEEQKLEIDPYYLGLWLGDGNRRSIRSITTNDQEIVNYLLPLGGLSSNTHKFEILLPKGTYVQEFKSLFELQTQDSLFEKFIPSVYLKNSIGNRLALLAGILDSDGHYVEKGKYYDLVLKDYRLIEGVKFLCQTLGFKVNLRGKVSKMVRNDGSVYVCPTHRLSIIPTGELVIPVKINRKKHGRQSEFKNRRLTGINVEKDVVDDYYGFELDGDHLFLLEDFTVTHNSGKSLVCAQTALDFLFQKQIDKILVTRAAVEVGTTLGFLPGSLDEKFDPYLEAFRDNLYKCYDKLKIDELIKTKQVEALPVQFIRGKTIDDVLVVEEAQNLSKSEMLAILTRLGNTGKIVINGDNEQKDIREPYNGLSYAIDLSKKISGIKYIKLKENHRSDLVGEILDYEYGG